MGIARKKKKKTLKAKMLGILTMCAMTSLLAAVIVSYMELRMIQNDSIEDNMKMYLDQITKNTDEAYYDMISIVNYMGPGGLIGNVTDSYLDAVDNFDRFVEQRSLRQELSGLGYVNTKLVGATYYDKEEKKELISGMNVRTLDGRQNALPKVVKCAGNVMQAAHASFLGSSEKTVFSVMREVVFGNGKKLEIYAEIEADMKTPEEINKEGYPYTYIQTDERGVAQYSVNPVIIHGQKLFSASLSKGEYEVQTREGYKIMAYRSQIGYINAVALPDNIYHKKSNQWRMMMTLIIVVTFLLFSMSVLYLYRMICRPLSQFRRQMVQIGDGTLQAVHEESDIAEFDSLMREVEQMKRQIENLISNMVEKEKSIQKIEFEKLLYQINPHFLLNTLNSIQWMAQMSHQREISEFVQRLKKLLSYNLGKEGRQTTLRMELEIVKEYIALQQMRYDFIIEMNIEDGSYLDQPTVRMLFQPLVENAIRYGLGDDEKISIQVFEDVARHFAVVTISDSGKGLNQEEIDEINQPFDYDWEYWKNENRGIGLRYVKAMPEIDGLELMQMCGEEFPEIKFVILSVYENFSYAQTAIRMGALDYISKISFSPEECGTILERVSAKYMRTCRDGHAEEENQEKVEELNRRWMHTRWIFSEKEFEDLCQKTKEISLRSAERIFVKSFHNIQLLSDGEGEFPSMDTVEEMLDWVHRWREHIYEESLSSSQKNDISAFAAVIKYVDGHIGENLRSEDVAERIGMSRSYFSTRFKEMTGETFHQYVIHRKMKTAAEWIEEGKKSITRIAVELGYDNFHYFAKVFAREHGCTPSEYRKESKNV